MKLPGEVNKRICTNIQDQDKEIEVMMKWEKFNELRKNGELCNIQIQSQEKKHPAHKCVLSTVSPYFKAIFTSPCSNSEDMVDLSDFSAQTIDFLLDFIYGVSGAEVTEVCELLRVAEFIQYDYLVDEIVSSARFCMEVSDCYPWYLAGKTSGVRKLAVLAKSMILSNYDKVRNVEEYKDSLSQIEAIVSVKEVEFEEEVVIAAGNTYEVKYRSRQSVSFDKMAKIDIVNRTVELFEDGLNNFYIGDYQVDDEDEKWVNIGRINSLKVCLFFVHQHEIVSVSISEDGYPDGGKIYLRKYIHQEADIDAPFQIIDAGAILKKAIFEHTCNPLFTPPFLFDVILESCFYDGTDSLYLVFRHKTKKLVMIFKYDLKSQCMLKNWATIYKKSLQVFPLTYTAIVLVQTESYGTLLIDSQGGLYDIQSFDFRQNSTNHSLEPLKTGRSCKKVKRQATLPQLIRSFTAFANEDLFLVSDGREENQQSVFVDKFDEKCKTWVNCSAINIGFSPRISGSFVYLTDVYVVVQNLKTVSESRDNENYGDQTHADIPVYQEFLRFYSQTKSLSRVDMQLPSNPTFSVIPAYFLV